MLNGKNKKYSSTNNRLFHQSPTNKHLENKLLAKFAETYDDSSDEEDTQHKIKVYDIQKSWQGFQNTIEHITDSDFLSFVAHAAGLKVLYSTDTTEQYYAAKINLLSSKHDLDHILQLQNIFIKKINISIDHALAEITHFITLSASSQSEQTHSQETLNQVVLLFKDQLNNFVQEQTPLLIKILKLKKPWQLADKKILFEQFMQYIVTKFLNIYRSTMVKMEIGYEAEEHTLTQLAKIKAENILKKLNIADKHNKEGRMSAITILAESDHAFTHLTSALRDMLMQCQDNGYIKNMLAKKLHNSTELNLIKYAYLKDIINIYLHNMTKQLLSQHEQIYFTTYFKLNTKNIAKQISFYFNMQLHCQLTHFEHEFYRRSLGKNYLFLSNNPSSFYSNILLSNRSQKRRMLNLQQALFKEDYVERFWRFSEQYDMEADVIENQGISVKFARTDKIEGLGGYEKVFEIITMIKDYFLSAHETITDAQIAKWVRLVFQGKPLPISLPKIDDCILLNKFQSLAYLLFGSEAVRNPAMIVINQMLIDLIIANTNYTFAGAFLDASNIKTDKCLTMPMVFKGAVSLSRALEARYQDFMPYAYTYPGPTESDKDSNQLIRGLINAEANIVQRWIDMKQMPALQQAVSEKKPRLILSAIEKEKSLWFGNAKEQQLEDNRNARRIK